VYVAYSHYLTGEVDIAIKTVECLMTYFQKHRSRFERIIDGEISSDVAMNRPHIRFKGSELEEIDQPWEHAQNDALGYFLWIYCQLVRDQHLTPTQPDIDLIALFPLYFEAIAYWQDEDSGHWEETRKIEASSIGVVVAALKALKALCLEPVFITFCCQYKERLITPEFLEGLIQPGLTALNQILPSECVQPGKARRYDAALLFLIYPLQLLPEEMAEQIVTDVINNLQGDYGIFRYLGDSFWCRDYEDIPESIRTSISSEREAWLQQQGRALQPGEEAQWCIFDPIVSAIFGARFQKTRQAECLQKQTFYLNRALGQLTADESKFGGFKCPELYYLKAGSYVPNDATPLLWTQANLRIALKLMEDSLKLTVDR
jgi:phosphorylase kinase alpha/beta subunit